MRSRWVPNVKAPCWGTHRFLGCTSSAFGTVGSGGWLKEVGDEETEAELQHRGRYVPRAIARCLCPSPHVAHCIAKHPPTVLQPPQAEKAPAPLGKRGHSTEELIGGFHRLVGHGWAGPPRWAKVRRDAVVPVGTGPGDCGTGGLPAQGHDSPQGRRTQG